MLSSSESSGRLLQLVLVENFGMILAVVVKGMLLLVKAKQDLHLYPTVPDMREDPAQ